MTYEKLWLKATYLLDHNKITLGEFEEMIKPWEKERASDDRHRERLAERI